MQTVPRQTRMLGSWKEIAAYLGKGVRTVQRWERQFGLPVRRPNSTARGVVCALPAELDEWFTVHWGQRNATPANGSGNGRGGDDGNEFHARLQVTYQLRDQNQQLLADVMQSARNVAAECRALAVQSGWHAAPTDHDSKPKNGG